MPKIKLWAIFVATLSSALLLPLSAQAEFSCQCSYYDPKRDNHITTCASVADAYECKSFEGGIYNRRCSLFRGKDCQIPADTETPLIKSSTSCSKDDDCKPLTQNIGKSQCIRGYCYFDEAAKRSYDQLHLGIIGTDLKPIPPILSIRIPGLNFSQSIITSVNADGKKVVKIPYLGEYISVMYKYGMGVATIVAVVMIMLQGARIITSAGGEDKMAAYQRIGQVVIGLALLWSSYTILYIINPDLVGLRVIQLPVVEREEMPEIDLPTPEEITLPPTAILCDNPAGSNLVKIAPVEGLKVDAREPYTTAQVYEALKRAARIAYTKGYVLDVTSACRSLARQQSLAQSNSSGNKVGNTIAKPGGSAHGYGTAVDVALLSKDSPTYGKALVKVGDSSTQCKEDPASVKTLSEIMYAAGFSRFTKENWHFEIPPRIPTCRSNSYTGLSPCSPKPGECP